MSSSTPNFNLIKPAGSENVNVADLNGNFDIIDSGVEPVHATQTVTGTNGSITISNALDAPLLDFTARGLGTPSVFYVPGMSASAQGQQDWDTPLVLDVPIGVIDSGQNQIFLNYGVGVGSNDFTPTAGKEVGTTVFWNSRELAALFKAADDAEATVTNEGTTFLFECPLPFSVASGSTVYCSHLKEQNVAGEEGIWASGSTLYLRILSNRYIGGFNALASVMTSYVDVVNYYTPNNIKGIDPQNWIDFFVMLTPSASYTKTGKPSIVTLANGSQYLMYFKISDYVAVVSGQGQPSPTAVPVMSATYYTDVEVNRTQHAATGIAINKRFEGEASLGLHASATTGGAVGAEAEATIGGAIGEEARETKGGGAVGYHAEADSGGAIGFRAVARYGGGAVGSYAEAGTGGAVGSNAISGPGCAIGYNAKCIGSGDYAIDAIQLGTGTNSTRYSMQVYTTTLLTPTMAGSNASLVIPPALLIASVGAMTAQEKTDFKTALGIS